MARARSPPQAGQHDRLQRGPKSGCGCGLVRSNSSHRCSLEVLLGSCGKAPVRLVEPLTELSGASFVPVFGVGMKRLILTVGLALAGALLVPSVAAADKPIREGLSAEDFTIEGSCAFDFDFQVLVNKEFILPALHLQDASSEDHHGSSATSASAHADAWD